MAWKTEKWLEEIFPGEENIYSQYRDLNAREFSVVSCAVIDAAIAELIAIRLNNSTNKEIETFLGVNGDGRAPCGSLGAKIQLGYLLGILTENDMQILRGFKNIRNKFSHSVNVSFSSKEIVKIVKNIHSLWVERAESLSTKAEANIEADKIKSILKHLDNTPEACHGFILGVFTTYQAYFHRLHGRLQKLNSAIVPNK